MSLSENVFLALFHYCNGWRLSSLRNDVNPVSSSSSDSPSLLSWHCIISFSLRNTWPQVATNSIELRLFIEFRNISRFVMQFSINLILMDFPAIKKLFSNNLVRYVDRSISTLVLCSTLTGNKRLDYLTLEGQLVKM